MRTREYVEKGENEGKSLLDAMRDGTNDGMQHFDGELERFVREGLIEYETALLYATNAGNLKLALSDIPEDRKQLKNAKPSAGKLTEVEIER